MLRPSAAVLLACGLAALALPGSAAPAKNGKAHNPAALPAQVQLLPPVGVWCGSQECFAFRVAAQGKTPDDRANAAMNTINKFLGGKTGRVSIRPLAPKSPVLKLMLNDEFLAHITPEDAVAEKQKTVQALADVWSKKLAAAFNASKAVP
jgi:hypothetical protein